MRGAPEFVFIIFDQMMLDRSRESGIAHELNWAHHLAMSRSVTNSQEVF